MTRDEAAHAIAKLVVAMTRDFDIEIPEAHAYAEWPELQRLATEYEVADAREQLDTDA